MQQTLSQWPKGKATSRLRVAVKIRNHLQFARESLSPLCLKQIPEYSHQTNPTSLSQVPPYVKSSHPESCILPFLLPLLSLLIRLLFLIVLLRKERERKGSALAICSLLEQVRPLTPVNWKVTVWGSSLSLTLLQKKPSLTWYYPHNRRAVSFTVCHGKSYFSLCQREPHNVPQHLLQDWKLIVY